MLFKFIFIMDDITYDIRNLEFHLKQYSRNYDKCLSKAIKEFLDSKADFHELAKPCEELKSNLDNLLRKYEEVTQRKFSG